MIRKTGSFAAFKLLVLAAGGSANVVQAQDTQSWQLPPSQTATSAPQGPVVPDAPPPRAAALPTPTPTPTPIPAPAPITAPTVTAPASPDPKPAAQKPATGTGPRAAATQTTIETLETPATESTAPAMAPTAAGQPFELPAALPPARSAATPSPDSSEQPALWPWAALAAVLVALAAFVFRRRGRTPDEAVVFEPPAPPAAVPPDRNPAEKAPAPAAGVHRVPALTLDLIAARMSASLVNATLTYRLTLSSRANLTDIEILGSMTSAHASRPTDDLLAIGDGLKLHHVQAIGTNETIELSGDVRLPLAEITPIRHGASALFVPLVRLEVTGFADGDPFRFRAAFVVGIEEEHAGGRLQPFRLDLGPRVYPQVGRRELTVPAFA